MHSDGQNLLVTLKIIKTKKVSTDFLPQTLLVIGTKKSPHEIGTKIHPFLLGQCLWKENNLVTSD